MTEYVYDAGNKIREINEWIEGKLYVKSYAYDENNRLIYSRDYEKENSYQYDREGNLTAKTEHLPGGNYTTTYAYDGKNRMSETTDSDGITTAYAYRYDGLRTSKTVGGITTFFTYNGGDITTERTDGEDGESVQYYRGARLIAMEDDRGNQSHFIHNAHGDVIAFGDETYDYSAFGERLGGEESITPESLWQAETGKTRNPFGYCGEYTDSETGFLYLRARYYDSDTARFTTEDPIRDGTNWYAYCENDPVNFIDSFGLASYKVGGLSKAPKFVHDPGFKYNPKAIATDADYKSWRKWNSIAYLSGFNPFLKDASKMYKNYLSNTGELQWIDYARAYKEDSGYRQAIDNELELMKQTVNELYTDGHRMSFEIIGTIQKIENGSSENWQKTLGAHQVYGHGKITINSSTGMATMVATFFTEDMYNFNPGQSDIVSGTPDDVNGRFAELGWAKEFKTYGSFMKTIMWRMFMPTNCTNERESGR